MITLHNIVLQRRICCRVPETLQFAKRIMENYELMQMQLVKADIINALLLPYEPGAQAGNTEEILVQNIKIKQQVILDVVNRLVNRLGQAVLGQQNYQDMVFIQAVLRKLGISGQKELINLIIKTSGISSQKYELVRLCNGSSRMFDRILKGLEEKKPRLWKRRKTKEGSGADKAGYYLHHSVCERLRLFEQYQNRLALIGPLEHEVQAGGAGANYAQAMENMDYADSLFVSRLNQSVFGIHEAEMFRSLNPYEKWTKASSMLSEEGLKSAFISAILLNLTRHAVLHSEGFKEMFPGQKQFIRLNLKGAVSTDSRMTAERFFFYHHAMRTADMENQRALLEAIQDGFAREVRILSSIRDISGRQEQETERKELIKNRNVIRNICNERSEVYKEELLSQMERMLYAVSRMEENIYKYISDSDLHYYMEHKRLETRYAELIHIRRGNEADNQDRQGIQSGRQVMEQEAVLKSTEYTDRKSIHMDLEKQNFGEVSRLVKENISGQMNALTDKVYERLEHRLQSEKKRRGY